MIYPLMPASWSFVAVGALWAANVGLARVCLSTEFAKTSFRALLATTFFGFVASHMAWRLFGDSSAVSRLAITIGSVSPIFLALTLLSIPFAGLFLYAAKASGPDAKAEKSPDVGSADERSPSSASVASADLPAKLADTTGPASVMQSAPTRAWADAPTEPGLPQSPHLTRRGLLLGAAALAPVAAVSVGVHGFQRGLSPVAIKPRRLEVPALPASLEGLRILQLSDVHLGVYRQLGDLEVALEAAARLRPDLVVLTGDFAEHQNLLPDALDLVRGLAPRLGVFACLGNHEYFSDVPSIRRTYDRKGIPLLVDDAVTVDATTPGARTRLSILGIDDPRIMRGDLRPTLRSAIERSLGRASGDFRLLLSHRPEAILPASALDVGLVLSGHTHGGQIGYNGKSAFEPLAPDGYLWGPYTRARTALYTTSGFGHWYPFRLGCESELPLLELTQGAIVGRTHVPRGPKAGLPSGDDAPSVDTSSTLDDMRPKKPSTRAPSDAEGH